jgi:hypothetical protein
MSYAGPASRSKRAPDMQLVESAPRRAPSDGGVPARRSPSYTDGSRRSVVFAAGVLLGIALGAGVALLLAPQSGADTRRAIARNGRRLRRRGRDAWDDLRDELRGVVHRRRLARQRRAADCDEPDEA